LNFDIENFRGSKYVVLLYRTFSSKSKHWWLHHGNLQLCGSQDEFIEVSGNPMRKHAFSLAVIGDSNRTMMPITPQIPPRLGCRRNPGRFYIAITVIWLEKISGGIWRRRLHHANPRILL